MAVAPRARITRAAMVLPLMTGVETARARARVEAEMKTIRAMRCLGRGFMALQRMEGVGLTGTNVALLGGSTDMGGTPLDAGGAGGIG